MTKLKHITILAVLINISLFAQNNIDINANVDVDKKTIYIQQTIVYQNTSDKVWNEIYLNDWNNSYSNKSTPLAKRFEEEFNTKFHLAKKKQRGYTVINSIKNKDQVLEYAYPKEHPDVIRLKPETPILPGASYTLKLNYELVLPDASFTDYGITKEEDFHLKHWYITPTVFDTKWNYYSNKNLDDLFIPKADISIDITYPSDYKLFSELDIKSEQSDKGQTVTQLEGKDRVETFLALSNSNYNSIETEQFTLLSDIYEKNVNDLQKAIITERVTNFLNEIFGAYPHKKLIASQIEYNKNPLYGINQLPDFMRPFKNEFQYELKLLKTALKKYLDNTLLTNPRKDYWLNDGIQIYFLMKYIEIYYPDLKLFGSLSNVWGLRTFHGAKLYFNFQYFLYSMEIARQNRDQPLSLSKDSLIKFNANIAGKYKAGLGLNYLDHFADDIVLKDNIKSFLEQHKLKSVSTKDFETFLKSKTKKDINWFFNDYVKTRKKIDFKIKSIETKNDSIEVTIRNKRNNTMPVSFYKLKKDSVIDNFWVENIKGDRKITVPKDSSTKIVLDYKNVIPEYNQRDNYKSVKGSFFNNKPLQFRLFKDIEDPHYNQVFLMPLVQYKNIYDGLTLGTAIYNKTILRKQFNYKISPQYATRSKSLTGGASVFYTHNLENKNLYDISYGINASYQSFAEDAFFTRIRPSISFTFRNDKDFRSDRTDRITARYVSIRRDIGPDAVIEELDDEPDYSVFNLRYTHSNPGIINFSRFNTDFQIAGEFSKVSFNYEFRKLTKSNRNINLRLFAGLFLVNNTDPSSDYFSFALDRPTDYLFDFNYLGRSEDAGLFSQQLIISEGGFKSQLDTPFANQWITTANFSTSIWRYIQAYGDIGLVKNKFDSAQFVYDSGIRLVLVEDYFELYFPVYSNLGWEIAQPNYEDKIRFIFTVNPKSLFGLFKRKWY